MNTSTTITQTKNLTHSQKSSLLSLAALCCQKDHISLSYPVLPKDNACHYLLTDSHGKLLSALAGLPFDSSAMECIAFTHPDHRKRGYFSRLLSLAMKDGEDQDILFPVSGSCPDTMAVLDSLNADLEYQEYKMEYVFPECESLCGSSPASNRSALSSPAPGTSLVPPSNILSKNASWSLLLTDCSASPQKIAKPDCPPAPARLTGFRRSAGSCLTSPVSQDTLCIHHVEILPHLRGKGLGLQLMNQLIYCLQKTHIRRLLLHVSGSNAPAVALYKKTGFGITETLSYYMY